MASLGGLISGVMGGVASGYTDYAKQRLDVDLKKELMAAEEEKLLRIDEIKRQRDIADIKPKAQATADAAPIIARGEAAAAPIKAGGEAAGQIAKTSTPGYLDSVSKETNAKESSSSKVQARLAGLSIDEKQKVQKLIDEYENPSTTPDRKAQIKDSLTVRGIIKPGEFGTEKVTTESVDPETGATTKTERTQKRSGAAQPPKGASGPKEGDTGTSKSGKPIVYRNGRWEYQ